MKRFYYIDNEGHKVAIQNYLVSPETITRVELALETKASQTDLREHTLNQRNPHNVTKAQVGLEYVDNTSDLDKPISTATQSGLDLKEDVANKVTSLSNSSTNTQYPSARVVYDELGLKENTSNKVTSLSYFSTDTQYPSAKAVYDQLSGIDEEVSGKENVSNKVTSLSSNSTDIQYPSAKVVYDEISAINTNITDNIEIDLAGKEDASNKVTSLSNSSTDTQYPSAKAVYDTIANTERTIALAEQHLSDTQTAHTNNTNNPHSVTKAQVGLGNVDNTSDLNKPMSTATKTYIDNKFSTTGLDALQEKCQNQDDRLDEIEDTIDSLVIPSDETVYPMDKYLSLASGISQPDILNETSKYHEIAKASSNPNMSVKACSVLYNLMKLEKENRFLTTFFLNLDYRGLFHKDPNGYDVTYINDQDEEVTVHYEKYIYQFRNEVKTGNVVTGYTPKEPTDKTWKFEPLSNVINYQTDSEGNPWITRRISNKTQLIYLFDFREFTDLHFHDKLGRAEKRAIFLTMIKKIWIDYKAIPVFSWHEGNPYTPVDFSLNGYNYTYDDENYPITEEYPSHRYVIHEILNETEFGDHTNTVPMANDTKCGFGKDATENEGLYDAPYLWFDAKCREIGQFIKDLYAFIGEEIPLIVRLWHECEDSWQWWGAAMTEVEDYKEFFKLSVQKINQYSESNSILYGYCTEKNIDTPTKPGFGPYELRYPGDDYVDILGYDDYHLGKPGQYRDAVSRLKTVSTFAKEHGKPAFIWETGNKNGDSGWFNAWVKAYSTPGINYAALISWPYLYPPYNIKPPYEEGDYEKISSLLEEYVQYFNRSNMPCAEENYDLTTVTDELADITDDLITLTDKVDNLNGSSYNAFSKYALDMSPLCKPVQELTEYSYTITSSSFADGLLMIDGSNNIHST